jgi:hypothetical protein
VNGDDVLQLAIEKLRINLAQLVAETAIWIHPHVFYTLKQENDLGVWYPNTRRYKQGKEKPGNIVEGIRLDNNNYANTAAKQALGLGRGTLSNFTVCHIWDDSCYDPKHHTCVANLVLVPRAISSLTDYDELTQSSLRYRAFALYGWYPDHRSQPIEPEGYPNNWMEPSSMNLQVESCLSRRRRNLLRI